MNEANINVVGISYDPVETLKGYSDKNSISFPLLSDAGSKTIDAYGIRNKQMDGRKFGPNDLSGIPHPGTYVLSKDGTVKAKLFLERYQERHTADELIADVKKASE